MDSSLPIPCSALWLAVAFPGLGLAVHTRALPRGAAPRPLALVQDGRVLACNAEAASADVRSGQRTAAAIALCPPLRLLDYLPAEEARLLRQLAEACIAVTPTVVLAPPHSLLLEVGGCLRLFRGQAGVLKALRRALKPFEVPAQLAQAPTPKAALALVASGWGEASLRVGEEVTAQREEAVDAGQGVGFAAEAAPTKNRGLVAPRRSGFSREPLATSSELSTRDHPGQQQSFFDVASAPSRIPAQAPASGLRQSSSPPAARNSALAPYLPLLQAVPVAALPWEAALQQKLAALQLHTLGELLALPRAALSKRLGVAATRYLAQLDGTLPDPQQPIRVAEDFESTLFFLDGISHTEGLRFPMKRLLEDFCRFLRQRQLACARFSWRFAHQDKSRQQLVIASARGEPQAARFLQLTELKLEHFRISAPVEAITLQAREFQPLSDTRLALLPAPGQEDEKALALLDRLRARLGAEACQQLQAANMWRPEQAQQMQDGAAGWRGDAAQAAPHPRPLPVGEGITAPGHSLAHERHQGGATPGVGFSPLASPAEASSEKRKEARSNGEKRPATARGEQNDQQAPGSARLDGQPALGLAAPSPLRPFWLWPQPQPLRAVDGRLWWQGAFTLLSRPERVTLPWWEDGDTRDYYLARHDNGGHYWLYFSQQAQAWFCQGVFG